MSNIRILGEKAIERIISLPMIMEAVENAYMQKHKGEGEIWNMVFHEFEPGRADLDIKSGNLDKAGIFGLKVVSWYGENPAKNLPALYGTSMIFDLQTGTPKALLNAGPITHFRTGAAGAIGAKYLARKDSEALLIAGCGNLAPYLIAAALLAMPELKHVTLVDPKVPEQAHHRFRAIVTQVDALLGTMRRSAQIISATDIEKAVGGSDIIFTATPSRVPFIKKEWVKPGTHFSCIGADMSGKQEIESALFQNARVYGDDEDQCMAVGECEIPYKEGFLSSLKCEIGAVMVDPGLGRSGPSDITIFDSTGIALQDLASAAALLEKAEQLDIGVVTAL